MCLAQYIDKITYGNRAASLFPVKPIIDFVPGCDAASGELRVLKRTKKTVVTLAIGPFRARHTVLQDSQGTVYKSRQLRALTPHRCTFGYDVLVYVGRALFVGGQNERQIQAALASKNVTISEREIAYLGKKFIVYLALAHRQSHQRLKRVMSLRGGYILHLDGTCEGDSPHLFTGIDGIGRIVLENIKLPSEKAELIVPFLQQIKRQYGDPIALVHDMGRGIISAVETVFPKAPDFICHFHFLRDVGKDLFEKEYAIIRNRLKTHKIRSVLRHRAKALEPLIGDDEQTVRRFAADIDRDCGDPRIYAEMPVLGAYALIHWCFDMSALAGYGFPFDCPHMLFYQRLKIVHALIDTHPACGKPLLRLWRPLTRIVEDQQLTRAATGMQKKAAVFEKLRKALSIALPYGKKGLNDDGREVDITSIEKKIRLFRETIQDVDTYRKMAAQIDKYWVKLFAQPIAVNTPAGQIMIQPQRTNNLLERFFRDFKRHHRKRSGTMSLSKTLRTMTADAPLAKNLENPEYMEIILNGCQSLEERFAKIDTRLVTEQLKEAQRIQQRLRPGLKKVVQRPDLPERLIALLAAQQ